MSAWVKAVRQQRHSVSSWNHKVAFNPHRVGVAGLYAEALLRKLTGSSCPN
jgi:hypothetical protein